VRLTLPSLRYFASEGGARAERDVAADDAVAAPELVLLAGEVHGAADAVGDAGGAAEELGDDHLRVGPAGQDLPVVAVAGDDVVIGVQRAERADGDRLLADVEVAEAQDLLERVGLGRQLLEAADEDHHPIPLQQLLAADGTFWDHGVKLPV
jgi:hypothetical protein